MDYDDLLVHLRTLLRDHERVRDTLADRYKYIMVDEYQDTNRVQAEIVWLLGAESERPGGRRRCTVHLCVPRRHRAEHPGIPGAYPGCTSSNWKRTTAARSRFSP